MGIHTLNKIVPSLCERACLQRRTSHCLRVTCASRLFNANEKEELIRGRSGHTSEALFRYEKANRGYPFSMYAKFREYFTPPPPLVLYCTLSCTLPLYAYACV